MKIRLLQPGWETMTGNFGGVEFVDGLSVGDVTAREAQRISNTVVCELEDGTNPSSTQAVLESYSRPMEVAGEAPAAPKPARYSEAELEAIAGEKGIKGLREIGDVLGVKTPAQGRYIAAIKQRGSVTFGMGAAGTGKTYIAGALAAEALQGRAIDRIIITRPAVDAGESMGFLPGELEEKYEPYIAAFRAVLEERLGRGAIEMFLKNGRIEAVPLGYMRGRTFKDAFVVMDEAQNATPEQMKLFLTRIGENCTVVVNGDETQVDIPGPCGLTDAVKRVGHIPCVKVVRFGSRDVVRSGFVQEVVEAYQDTTPDLPRAA
ncbi:MAG: PhoH family protein [Pseudomonadota bacterium]|nr:PhoH family protein [Pseudomonadota bacterium]